jgi:hypothetical protein
MGNPTPFALNSVLKASLDLSDGCNQNLMLNGCLQDSQINEFMPKETYTLAPSAADVPVALGRMATVKYMLFSSDNAFEVSVDDNTHYVTHGTLAVITGSHTLIYLKNPSSTAVSNVICLLAGNR